MRFAQLDTLRFVFASIVVLGHTSGWDKTVPSGGMSVDFFFVLSGFVLSHSIIIKENKVLIGEFVISRVARLFPLYLLSLLILFTVSYLQNNPPGIDFVFFQNIFLLQNIIPNGSLGYNWPAWSVSAEFWTNITIFFLMIKHRNIPIAMLLCFYCYLTLLNQQIIDHAHMQKIFITTAGSYRCVAGLSLGYLVYETFFYIQPLLKNGKLILTLCSLLEAVISITILLLLFRDDLGSKFTVILLFPFLILIFACGKGVISIFLSLVLFKKLGDYTYCIYLIHAPLLVYLRGAKLLAQTDVMTPLIYAFQVLLISALIAIPVYKYFEMPSKNYIKKISRFHNAN